jgi:ATP-dependent Clp protease ATP-binding subunit ClpA
MTVVPFLPLPPEVLREITALKLGALKSAPSGRATRSEAVFTEALIENIAARCSEAESRGAERRGISCARR